VNRDDIIRMAREAGVHHINLDDDYVEEFVAFAQLVAAAEREACAKAVEDAVDHREPASTYVDKINQHFGVEE
jgi:hypothetical protein